jgi:hypothetical protein
MKINFTEIKLVDVDGQKLPESAFHKTIANILYQKVQTLDLVDVAMKINKGEEVEVSAAALKEIETVLLDPKSGLWAFARKAVKDYIASVTTK